MDRISFLSNEIHIDTESSLDHTNSGSEDSLVIPISYYYDRQLRVMNRPISDTIDKTLFRIEKSLGKKCKLRKTKSGKDKKQQKQTVDTAISNFVTCGDTVIDCSKLLNSQFESGMVISINNSIEFRVVVNPPTIKQLNVYPRKNITVGKPIIANANVVNGNHIDYLWCIEVNDGKPSYLQEGTWIAVCDQKIFYPSLDHIGCRVKIYCTPKYIDLETNSIIRTGRTDTLHLNSTVKPAMCKSKILEVREEYIAIKRDHRHKTNLRVVSFNILAEPYALDRMFPYCKNEYLDAEYRAQLVVEELLAYDADVILLQECDRRTFELYYNPILSILGNYNGHYTNKSSGVSEGCATFTNKGKLIVIRRIDLTVKQVLRTAPYLAGIYALRPDLRDAIGGKIGTVGQITVCQNSHSNKDVVIFLNTHLFYHPLAGFARILAIDTMMSAIRLLRAEGMISIARLKGCIIKGDEYDNDISPLPFNCIVDDCPADAVSVIISGDLNSTPETAVVQYLDTGNVGSDDEVWMSINDFHWGNRLTDGDDAVDSPSDKTVHEVLVEVVNSEVSSTDFEDICDKLEATYADLPTLAHDLKLTSSVGYPAYTNYTANFQDLLDYIYIDAHYRVTCAAPYPSKQVLEYETALPSSCFPSDHIAVAVDVQYIA